MSFNVIPWTSRFSHMINAVRASCIFVSGISHVSCIFFGLVFGNSNVFFSLCCFASLGRSLNRCIITIDCHRKFLTRFNIYMRWFSWRFTDRNKWETAEWAGGVSSKPVINAVHVKCMATCRYMLKPILSLVLHKAYWAPARIKRGN